MSNPDAGQSRLRLFGRFALFTESGAEVKITSRRGRGLLAYLYLTPGNAESRDKLCGLFWGDRGDAQARASLRQCLLELRDTLADAGINILEAGREKVMLHTENLASDLALVRQAASVDESSEIVAALAMIDQQELLADPDLVGQYEEWLQQTRSRVQQTIAAAIHSQLERLERAGRWSDVRDISEAYLARDPLDETVAAAAIRADAVTGNTASAYRRFRILQEAMSREFGAVPGPTAREALALVSTTVPEKPPVAAAGVTRSLDESPSPPLVIVALFETGRANSDEVRLATMLRDEVVAGLSRFRDLRVVTDPRPVDQLGDPFAGEVGAAYVLGANLRAGPDGGRLTARLIRTRDRFVIWSDGFEAPESDVVDAIDSIIARVVGAVLPMIDSDLVRNASHLPSAPIYERYVVARDAAARAKTYEQARAAAKELETLVLEAPSFALPYLPLAFLYNTDFWYTRAWSSGPELRERALELGKTALALDRGHVHGYTICGWSYLRRRQWEPARIYLEQAYSLNPFHPRRVMEVGYGFLFLGDTGRARKLLNRHLLLNPEPDDFYYMDLGLLSFVEGDMDRAVNYLELIANPDIWALLYQTMTAKDGGHPYTGKSEAFQKRLATLWPPDQPMTADSVLAWVSLHHPFQARDTEERFLNSVRGILPDA